MFRTLYGVVRVQASAVAATPGRIGDDSEVTSGCASRQYSPTATVGKVSTAMVLRRIEAVAPYSANAKLSLLKSSSVKLNFEALAANDAEIREALPARTLLVLQNICFEGDVEDGNVANIAEHSWNPCGCESDIGAALPAESTALNYL